jgi:hypothetical protein
VKLAGRDHGRSGPRETDEAAGGTHHGLLPELSAILQFKKEDPSRGTVGWGPFSDASVACRVYCDERD